MRGISRASLAELRDKLAALVHGPVVAELTGDEMFAVVKLLDGEHGLRRALADPAKPGAEKSAIVSALVHGKVAPVTEELVATASSMRWASPGDFTDALEETATESYVLAAGYEGTLDDLEDDLFRFARVIAGQPDLRIALTGAAPETAKRELVHNLLGGKVSGSAEALITRLVTRPRGRSPQGALEAAASVAARYREQLLATVRVAGLLTDRQRQRLRAALQETYGHPVHLNVILDPAVIGGMSVQVGDELMDGTAATRVAEVKRRLAS
jgi:F-type H+-transporting ATPase subunit delta